MIRRRRPEEPPELKRQRLFKIALVLSGQDDRDIATNTGYDAGDVRKRLVDAQHGTCAYCADSDVEASHYDIEHFRP